MMRGGKQPLLALFLVGGVSFIVVGDIGCQTEVSIDGDRSEVIADGVPLPADQLCGDRSAFEAEEIWNELEDRCWSDVIEVFLWRDMNDL